MASPSSSTSDESLSALQAILARPNPLELSKQDLHLILPHLTSSPSLHSLSLAILSRSTSPTPSSLTRQSIQTTLHSLLSGTNSSELITGLSTLSALLQVSPEFVERLLLDKEDESLRSILQDVVEHISRPVKSKGGKGKEKEKEEQKALVELLSLASGQSGMRKLVKESAGDWLESLLLSKEKGDGEVKAMAAVGIVKLRLGKKEIDPTKGLPPREEEEKPSKWSLEDLAKLFVNLVVEEEREGADKATKEDDRLLLASLEGLAYLTLTPSPEIKRIASTSNFLSLVFSFASTTTKPSQPPTNSNAARDYAIATLLHHLTTFPTPEDSQSEAAQVERLKRFASAGGGGQKATPTETVEQVTSRVVSIVKHSTSPIPTVRQLCLSPSLQTRRLAGQILHSLVTPQSLRGQLLQSGVARLLLTLIRNIPTPFDPSSDLAPIQALSKLFITSNPLLIFYPTPLSPLLLEASQALTLPLGVSSSSSSVPLLAIFESLMALTNIASLDPELTDLLSRLTLRDRTSSSPQLLLSAVEELLVNENKMVRRAAIELVCNLVGSEMGIEYFEPPSGGGSSNKTTTTRLHLLLALASSEDVPTRLAATGALTSFVYSKKISMSLTTTDKYVELMLGGLEDDEPGVRHRVYEAWRGLGEVLGEGEEGEEKVNVREGLRKRNVVRELEKAGEREDVVDLRESIEGAIEGIKKLLK